MQRVKTATATTEKPAYSATGTPGYFRAGDPVAAIPATVPGQDWFNMMQEEPLNVILAAGLTPDPEDDTQLLQAVLLLIAANAPTPELATEEAAGIAQIASTAEVEAGTDDATIITPAKLAAALAALGGATVDNAYVGAGGMTPEITDGAALAQVEDTAADGVKLTRNIMSFQGSTKDTHAYFSVQAPDNWDGGTIRAKVHWKGAAGCSPGDNVRYYLASSSVGDGDTIAQALGAVVTVDDTVETDATRCRTSAASAAMTPSGTPAAGERLYFRLSRDYDYGAQPMSEAAEVLGVTLQFGITGNLAAWA